MFFKKRICCSVLGMQGMPHADEFATCLHKIKCGFNLLVCALSHIYTLSLSLYIICTVIFSNCNSPSFIVTVFYLWKCSFWQGEMNGKINDPSAPEFVHCLFATLAFVSHYMFFALSYCEKI